jgi:hypothetical protein
MTFARADVTFRPIYRNTRMETPARAMLAQMEELNSASPCTAASASPCDWSGTAAVVRSGICIQFL